MLKLLAATTLAVALSGCGLLYKVDVYQGNLLDPEAVAQVKPGLSKRQVHSLLGSPSVEDPFHHSRWDYVSTISRRGAPTMSRTSRSPSMATCWQAWKAITWSTTTSRSTGTSPSTATCPRTRKRIAEPLHDAGISA